MNQTPRVSGRVMGNYVGRSVLLMCNTSTVSQDQNGNHIVRSTDGETITAILPPGELFESKFVQLTGKVLQPGVLKVVSVQAAGDNLDVDKYNSAVTIVNGPYKQLYQ